MTKRVEVGVHTSVGSRSGWWRLIEQERVPFRVTAQGDAPITLFESELPDWLPAYLEAGGIAVIIGAEPERLPFPERCDGHFSLSRAQFSPENLKNIELNALGHLYQSPGWGEVRTHENRRLKSGLKTGFRRVVHRRELGDGVCFFTGLPLTKLLISQGDRLRRFSCVTEVTERVSAVDKRKIMQILVWLLRESFATAGLPYVHLWYFPWLSPSAFMFRIDVDGAYDNNVERISNVASESDLRVAFFLNKSLSRSDVAALQHLNDSHDVGNHCDIHDIFDDVDANTANLSRCDEWMAQHAIDHGPWFVAPRGMWNEALGTALERGAYVYSSEFGYDFDGFPFFPRIAGMKSSVLQVPVHPYSVERASVYAQDHNLPEPDASTVRAYFTQAADIFIRQNLPVFFYSHPEKFGVFAEEVIPPLLDFVRDRGAIVTAPAEFAAFWHRRDKCNVSAEYNEASGQLRVSGELGADIAANVIADRGVKAQGPGKWLGRHEWSRHPTQ